MRKQILCLTLLVLMVLAMVPVQALTITMANPGGIAERDVIVYYTNNGTMQGYYNSTSVITIDANSSYIFVLKPMNINPLEDPTGFVGGFFVWVKTNIVALVGIAILIGFAASRR